MVITQNSVFHCEVQWTLTAISLMDPASLTKINLAMLNLPEFTCLPLQTIRLITQFITL